MRDPAVEALRVCILNIEMPGHPVGALGFSPVRGSIPPTMIEGRAPGLLTRSRSGAKRSTPSIADWRSGSARRGPGGCRCSTPEWSAGGAPFARRFDAHRPARRRRISTEPVSTGSTILPRNSVTDGSSCDSSPVPITVPPAAVRSPPRRRGSRDERRRARLRHSKFDDCNRSTTCRWHLPGSSRCWEQPQSDTRS